MAEVTKVTKVMKFEAIRDFLSTNGADASLVECMDNEIALVTAKAEKAKVRAAEKKAINDELGAIVEAALTNEFQSAESILGQIEFTPADGKELTKQMIVSRLSKIVKNGVATKSQEKVGDKRVMCYKLAD